jgi:hypothetical protein
MEGDAPGAAAEGLHPLISRRQSNSLTSTGGAPGPRIVTRVYLPPPATTGDGGGQSESTSDATWRDVTESTSSMVQIVDVAMRENTFLLAVNM